MVFYTVENKKRIFNENILIKGTVSVMSSDPPSKDSNARFTKVPLKPLSDQ